MRELLPDDAQMIPELDAAMTNASQMVNLPMTSTSVDFSLCHGIAGQGELLLLLATSFGRQDLATSAQRLGEIGIQLFHTSRLPWFCGMPDCGETPSLMTGTAGIGLFYLRLLDPVGTPSVLLPAATKTAESRNPQRASKTQAKGKKNHGA
jgi:hypothetical protein